MEGHVGVGKATICRTSGKVEKRVRTAEPCSASRQKSQESTIWILIFFKGKKTRCKTTESRYAPSGLEKRIKYSMEGFKRNTKTRI